jgi:hypothetical protein
MNPSDRGAALFSIALAVGLSPELLPAILGVNAIETSAASCPEPPGFGFVPVPAGVPASIGLVTILYVAAAEILKRWFFRPALRPSAASRVSHATRSRFRPNPDPVR